MMIVNGFVVAALELRKPVPIDLDVKSTQCTPVVALSWLPSKRRDVAMFTAWSLLHLKCACVNVVHPNNDDMLTGTLGGQRVAFAASSTTCASVALILLLVFDHNYQPWVSSTVRKGKSMYPKKEAAK